MALQDVVTREYTINLHKRVCLNPLEWDGEEKLKEKRCLELKLGTCWIGEEKKRKNLTGLDMGHVKKEEENMY